MNGIIEKLIIEERRESEARGEKRGEKRGMELGEKRGAEDEKLKIAKDMKKKGLEFALIMELTGLSESKIAAL